MFFSVLSGACASGSAPVEPASSSISAVAYSADNSRLLISKPTAGGCDLLELDSASGAERDRQRLPFCPDRLVVTSSGLLLKQTGQSAWWPGDQDPLLAAAGTGDYVTRSGSGAPVWIRGDRRITLPDLKLRDLRVLDGEDALIGIRIENEYESLVRISESGEVIALIPDPVRQIDSYDVSPDQKELVVSARRAAGFDVALGSTASAAVRWVAADPLDEVMVSWAPRGSKVTYLVKAAEGSLLRTLHVPTGYELMIDLPQMEVSQLAWEPRAERFAVVVSAPGRSTSVMTMTYSGEDRRMLLAGEHQASVEMEPFAWQEGTGWLVRRARVVYGAKYPVIVWTGVTAPFAWSEVRGESYVANEAISIMVPGDSGTLTSAFWREVEKLPLADRRRLFVVASPGDRSLSASLPAGAQFVGRDEIPRGLRAALPEGKAGRGEPQR